MKKIIPLIFSVFYLADCSAQAVGGWGNCEFATVATMNAFDPSTNAFDCKKVYVQATGDHYHWDGTNWILDGSQVANIYNADGTLEENRTVTMDGNNLIYDGAGTGDVIIESDGDVGIGTTSPDRKLDVENGRVRFSDYGDAVSPYTGTETYLLGVDINGDIIELDLSDYNGTGTDDQTATEVTYSNTTSGLTATNTQAAIDEIVAGNPFDNIYNEDGTLDEARTVTLDGNNLLFDGAGTGDVIIESDGDFGIGTTSPDRRLDVENGRVRFSDYGDAISPYTGTETYLLGVDINGDLIEIDLSDYNGTGTDDQTATEVTYSNTTSGLTATNTQAAIDEIVAGNPFDNIYNEDGTLDEARTVTLDGNNLLFDGAGTGDVIIESDGDFGIGTTSPDRRLDVENGRVRFSDYGDAISPYTGTETYLLGVDINGDLIEIDLSDYNGTGTDDQTATEVTYSNTTSGLTATNTQAAIDEIVAGNPFDNIYNEDGTLDEARTVTLDGNDLTFTGNLNDIVFESTGNVGIGIANPTEELEVAGDAKVSDHLYVGPDATVDANSTTRIVEDFAIDANTYQLYSNPTITATGGLTGNRTSYGAYMNIVNNKAEGTGNSDAIGGYFEVDNSGTNTFRSHFGIRAFGENNSIAGTGLGTLYGGHMRARHNGTVGTIGNSYGALNETRGRSSSATTGIISNGYGSRSNVYPYNTDITTGYGTYGNAATNRDYSGDITSAFGVYGRAANDSENGGNITTARGGFFSTTKRETANLITNSYGVQVDANAGVTTYGIRVDADDDDPTTNYGIYIDAANATNNNYGIFGERGDWVLDEDGDGDADPDNPGDVGGGDLFLGDGQDLELYHDGTNSYIMNNTGDLYISDAGTDDVILSNNGGRVGIGTTSPERILDVENGRVRFSDYGDAVSPYTGTETYLLGVDVNGDVIELDLSDYNGTGTDDQTAAEVTYSNTTSGLTATNTQAAIDELAAASGSNIYTANGTLGADRTVDMDGNDLTFSGTGSNKIQIGTFGGNGGGKLQVDVTDGDATIQGIKTVVQQTTGANYAINGTAEGIGATTNTGLYGWASGATNNRGLWVNSGFGIFDDKVGIGTTNPGAQLEVTYDRNQSFTVAEPDDGTNSFLSSVVAINTNSGNWSRALTALTPNIADGSVSGLLTFGQGDATRQAGHMYFVDTGADGDEYIGFGIRNGSANILNITGGGNVGIGTNSPAAKFDVDNGTVRFSDYGAGTYEATPIYFLGVEADGDVIEVDASGIGGDDLGDHTLTENIQTDDNWISNDGGDEGIYIETDGDVGIGTDNPTGAFEVAGGQVRFSNYGSGSNTGTSTQMLSVTADGDIVEMNTVKSASIFYPPAVAIPANAEGTGFTFDLHAAYKALFDGPAMKNGSAPALIPSYTAAELNYYVVDYDTNVFTVTAISDAGVMTFNVDNVPTDNCSYMNVVFVVK